MKRRTKGLLLALTVCALGGVVLAGCGETDETGHTHDWGEWTVTTPAGCETPGVKERSCKNCTEKETDTIPAAGHDWNDWVVTTPAGCETPGVKERSCKNCTEKETDTVAETGHSWVVDHITVQPTYAKDGTAEYACENTGCEETKTDTVERLGYEKKTQDVWESKSIKVLGIGNSRTDDVCQYLSAILHAMGFTDVTVAWAWIPGGTLASHERSMKENALSYTWEYQNEGDEKYTVSPAKIAIDTAFDYAEWDFVLLNTLGEEQGHEGFMTEEQLNYLAERILTATEGNACPVWYTGNLYALNNTDYYGGADTTYTSRDDHYKKAIAMVQERIATDRKWQAIVPSITAVYNLSSAWADSVIHRDGGHLTYPVGCTAVGIACAATLAPQADLDALKLSFVSDAMLEDIKLAVSSAIEHPWERTPLSLEGTEIDGYAVRHGSFEESGNGFRSLSEQSLIEGEGSVPAGEITFRLAYAALGWNGAVFALTPGGASYWESGASYYFAGISENGTAMLVKVNGISGTAWNVLVTAPLPAADANGGYDMAVKFKEGKISLEVNGKLALGYTDASPLEGTGWGFRAEHRATVFTDIAFTPNDNIEVPEAPTAGIIEGWTARHSQFTYDDSAKAYTAFGSNAILQRDEDWNGGTVTFDFTMGAPADAGVLFGLSGNGNETFWEDAGVTYYMAAVTRTGGVAFAAVNLSADKPWTWLTEPAKNMIPNFSLEQTYQFKLAWAPALGIMQLTVGGVSVSYSDVTLTGRGFGFRAGQAGNTWANLTFTDALPTFPGSEHGIRIVSGDWEVGTDENGKKSFTNKSPRSLFFLLNPDVDTLGNDVTVEFDFKSTFSGSDVQGVVFAPEPAKVSYGRGYVAVGKWNKGATSAGWNENAKWSWGADVGTNNSANIFSDETKTYKLKVVWHKQHDGEGEALFDIYVNGTCVRKRDLGNLAMSETFKGIGFTTGGTDTAVVTYSNIRINGTEI